MLDCFTNSSRASSSTTSSMLDATSTHRRQVIGQLPQLRRAQRRAGDAQAMPGAATANTSPARTCHPRAASASTCGWLSAGNGSHRFNPSIGSGVGTPRARSSSCSDCRRCW
jgi:hypothetical protein